MKSSKNKHKRRTKPREVAEDIRDIFQVKRHSTAEVLAQEFVERYRGRFPRAVEIFEQGISEILIYLDFSASHQRHIRVLTCLRGYSGRLRRGHG